LIPHTPTLVKNRTQEPSKNWDAMHTADPAVKTAGPLSQRYLLLKLRHQSPTKGPEDEEGNPDSVGMVIVGVTLAEACFGE